ncbi:MAG: hypothetical protein Kow0077_04280 [Anaerolineae bacterium]
MRVALRAIRRALQHVWVAGYTCIWANVAFVVLSLPVVTLPAAWSALVYVHRQSLTEPTDAVLGTFWETFKSNLGRSVLWGGAHLLFAVINFGNLAMFWTAEGAAAAFLRTIWLVAGIAWLAVVLYTWPIYYAMETPSVRRATRNALVMVGRNPALALMIVSVTAIVGVASMAFAAAWLLLTWSVWAVMAVMAVDEELAAWRGVQ